MKLSFIIPVLNEAEQIPHLAEQIVVLQEAGHEVIVVDGGSQDQTLSLARQLTDKVIESGRGRARQMNVGASTAQGDGLVFLHADSRLPENAECLIRNALEQHQWGRFDVRLSGQLWLFRVIEGLMNLRSCLTGIATGDQCLFVRREVFEAVGGYADIALMEDIALSQQLKCYGRPVCLKQKVTTSSRHWEQRGVFKTIILMWCLRLGYFLGVSPDRLRQIYYSS